LTAADDGLLHLQHALEQRCVALRDVQRIVPAFLGAEARGHALDVAAGREGLARAGEDDDVDLAVVARSRQTCSSSACISACTALRLSGWLSVSVAMPPSRWIVRYL
jgi:hypothetical protein